MAEPMRVPLALVRSSDPNSVPALRARIDELEEEIRQLKEAFAPVIAFPLAWGLTPKEATLLAALYRSRASYVSKESLYVRVCGCGAEVDPKIIDVFLCKLRAKLARHGLAVRTRRSAGYYITPECRAAIDSMLGRKTWAARPPQEAEMQP